MDICAKCGACDDWHLQEPCEDYIEELMLDQQSKFFDIVDKELGYYEMVAKDPEAVKWITYIKDKLQRIRNE